MKRHVLFLMLIAATLAGCSAMIMSKSALRDAQEQAQAAYAACNAQLRSGVLKSYRQAVACARPKVLAAYQRAGYPYMDLVNLDLYAHQEGADRIDSGAASPAAVNRDLAILKRRIAAEQQRRLAARTATGGAAPPIPLASLLAGLTAITGASNAAPATNCFKVGSFTHCE